MRRRKKASPVAALVIFLIFLLILFIASAFTSCTSIGAGSSGAFSSVSYLADDNVIDQAELTYTEWETDLQLEINRMETIRSGYDEYRYDVDEIGHDPHVLMAYLTAVYGDFNSSQAESAMRSLFDSQYHLTLTEEVERRTRTEPATDPTTHQQTTTNVAYDYKILNVKLTSVSLESVVSGHVNSEQRDACDTLLTTKGCRQYVKNVFGSTNWLSNVTSYYGYRVHPVSGGYPCGSRRRGYRGGQFRRLRLVRHYRGRYPDRQNPDDEIRPLFAAVGCRRRERSRRRRDRKGWQHRDVHGAAPSFGGFA